MHGCMTCAKNVNLSNFCGVMINPVPCDQLKTMDIRKLVCRNNNRTTTDAISPAQLVPFPHPISSCFTTRHSPDQRWWWIPCSRSSAGGGGSSGPLDSVPMHLSLKSPVPLYTALLYRPRRPTHTHTATSSILPHTDVPLLHPSVSRLCIVLSE